MCMHACLQDFLGYLILQIDMCAIVHEEAYNMDVSLLRCNHQRSQTILNKEVSVCILNNYIANLTMPTKTSPWSGDSHQLFFWGKAQQSCNGHPSLQYTMLSCPPVNTKYISQPQYCWGCNLQLNSNFKHSCKVLFITHCKDLTIPEFVDLLVHHYQWACSQSGHVFFDMQSSGESNHSKEEGYNYNITILLICPC